MSWLVLTAAFVIIVAICLLVVKLKDSHKSLGFLPPSPPSVPVLGNLHLLKGAPHQIFHQLSKQHGPVITFWFGRKPVIVVNDIDLAKEAMIKKDPDFAGRPRRYTGGIYSRGFKGIVLSDYDEMWEHRRKIAHMSLKTHGDTRRKTEDIINTECTHLVQTFLDKAVKQNIVDPNEDISVAIINVLCSLCFGSRYSTDDDEFKRIYDANSWLMEGLAAAQLIDSFPILRYIPYRKHQLVLDYIKVRDEIIGKKFREHETEFDPENIRDFTDALLKARNDLATAASGEADSNDEESKLKMASKVEAFLCRENCMMIVSDLFVAGVETTVTALLWAILYLSVWPSKQKKAQDELDALLKGNREPKLSDKPELPFIEAIIQEVLRLSSLVPLGVPRKAAVDTKLAGYDIPKGTTVLFNTYAMHHDESQWKNPQDFVPERFLDENGKCNPSRTYFMPFSAGRRVCLGENIAKMALFLVLSHLLYNFEFHRPNDSQVIDLEGVIGATLRPKPFKVQVIPRHRVAF